MTPREEAAALAFGFSGLEAAVYVALLRHGSQTGYGAAKLTKKPVANCYKALESLAEKSAVVASHGDTVLFSATEPSQLARTLSQSFGSQFQQAATTLSRIHGADVAGDVFRIADASLALEKARSILATARDLVLVDAFPDALSFLAPLISATNLRGVRVIVKSYGKSDVKVAQLIQTPDAETILKRWPGQWLIVVADGRELLLAFFENDLQSLLQGVWTKSPYLSWLYHYSLASEFALTALQFIASSNPDMPVRDAISRATVIDTANALGYQSLKRSWLQGENQ